MNHPTPAYYIGVSGHRSLENPRKVRLEIVSFLKKQKDLNPHIIGLSALAEGVDSIFAEEILNLGLKLEVILPFQEKEYKKDFSESALIKFKELCAKAESIRELTPITENATDREQRRQGYLNCGKAITNESDLMLFVFNGDKANGKGGTGDIYKYCKGLNQKYQHILAFQNSTQRTQFEKQNGY